MEYIDWLEVRIHWVDFLEKVVSGQSIIITKHGKPIARIAPEHAAERRDVNCMVSQIKTLRQGTRLDGLDWKKLRSQGSS